MSDTQPTKIKLAVVGLLMILLTTLVPAQPASAKTDTQKRTIAAWTDYLMTVPIDNFMAAKQSLRGYTGGWIVPVLDWSSDGCSNSPDTGWAFDFQAACQRHDFCYRNNKTNMADRTWKKGSCDRAFRSDMRRHCAGRSHWLKFDCYKTAGAYYTAVKAAGRVT